MSMFFNGLNLAPPDTLGMFDPIDWGNNGGSSGGTISTTPWWHNAINNGFNLASQIVGGWSQNPTQQFGVGGQPWGGPFSAQAVQMAQAQSAAQQQQALAAQQAAINNNVRNLSGNGGLAEDAFAGITNFISRNPLPVAAGVLGLYLLMREPPRGRR